MSLPRQWVERIFEKLAVVYGQDFVRLWEGMDMDRVMDDWANRLAPYERAKHALQFALENLPARPPNCIQFEAIAQRAPAKPMVQLEAPRADPVLVQRELAKARALLVGRRKMGP